MCKGWEGEVRGGHLHPIDGDDGGRIDTIPWTDRCKRSPLEARLAPPRQSGQIGSETHIYNSGMEPWLAILVSSLPFSSGGGAVLLSCIAAPYFCNQVDFPAWVWLCFSPESPFYRAWFLWEYRRLCCIELLFRSFLSIDFIRIFIPVFE